MTKTEKKVADLEKRVKELEARPAIVILPALIGYQANPPAYPWYTPIVTCTPGATTWTFR